MKVPGLVNLYEKVLFGDIFPLSKTPVSLVTVWKAPSLLVQVTVVPCRIVIVAGENEKLVIITVLPEMGTVEEVVGCVPYPELQAMVVAGAAKTTNISEIANNLDEIVFIYPPLKKLNKCLNHLKTHDVPPGFCAAL